MSDSERTHLDGRKSGEIESIGNAPGESPALLDELQFLLTRAGHDVPTDRLAGILAGYHELKIMFAHLRQPRTAANEPANVYSLETITRGE